MILSNVSGASENKPPKKIEPTIIPAEQPITITALSGLNGIDNLTTSNIQANAVRYTQRVENCACGISVMCFKIASKIVSAETHIAVGNDRAIIFTVKLPFTISLFGWSARTNDGNPTVNAPTSVSCIGSNGYPMRKNIKNMERITE